MVVHVLTLTHQADRPDSRRWRALVSFCLTGDLRSARFGQEIGPRVDEKS